jgi:GT2 family glycosyltransferase
MRVSVVVPTFNRGPALAETLARLLASELDGGDELEIVVVDDGSPLPAQDSGDPTVRGGATARWPLRWIRQANAGPAAARNAGFGASAGEIVIFVDDDILVPPDLVRSHLEGHRARPGTVICGENPFAPRPEFRSLRAFLEDAAPRSDPDKDGFERITIVASGQLSVERGQFAAAGAVYSPEMVTPAAEEYELSYRLRERGIPVLAARRIVALHDQPLDIASYCRQQYKHGLGCGEAAAKRPELLALGDLARIVAAARGERPFGGRLVKTIASRPPSRAGVLGLARALERMAAPARLRSAAYRAAIGAHFVAGVRDGLARFAPAAGRGGVSA